jgi:2,3,4,5-tetrahydropyridine-2-carboxylate N-succinyltransferase
MSKIYSFGIGIGTKNNAGEWLEVFYPLPLLNPDPELAALLFGALGSNQTDLEPSTDQLSALESALITCGYSELAENVAHLKTSSKPIVASVAQ